MMGWQWHQLDHMQIILHLASDRNHASTSPLSFYSADALLPPNPQRQNIYKLECRPMPNLMVALPNIGGALCSTPQSLADAHY